MMEFLAKLSKLSPKVMAESERDQETSEFSSSNYNQELVNEIEAEFEQKVTDLYRKAEDQCNQIISNIKSSAEYDQVIPDFSAPYDNQKLANETKIEFDQIISDLFNRTEDQFNQIISIIRTYTKYIQTTSEFTTSFDYQELIDGNKTKFEQIISDLFRRTEGQCNQILSIIERDA